MTDHHHPIHVNAFQLKLKAFCIWIEGKFGERLGRAGFLIRVIIAAAIFVGIIKLRATVLANAPWGIHLLAIALFVLTAFWLIIQVVCRFRGLGRSGQLFWAIVVPFAAASRIAEVGHLWDRFPERKGLAIGLFVLCAWSIWLTLQLFLAPNKPAQQA